VLGELLLVHHCAALAAVAMKLVLVQRYPRLVEKHRLQWHCNGTSFKLVPSCPAVLSSAAEGGCSPVLADVNKKKENARLTVCSQY